MLAISAIVFFFLNYQQTQRKCDRSVPFILFLPPGGDRKTRSASSFSLRKRNNKNCRFSRFIHRQNFWRIVFSTTRFKLTKMSFSFWVGAEMARSLKRANIDPTSCSYCRLIRCSSFQLFSATTLKWELHKYYTPFTTLFYCIHMPTWGENFIIIIL